MAQKTAIPVGTQFSPALFDLASFLKVLVAHTGNRSQIQDAFWAPPVHLTKTAIPASRRTASLPLEAAAAYGLMERKTHKATPLAVELSALQGPALYAAFARHILMSCGGLRVVDAAQRMRDDGLQITGDTLAQYLTDEGFPVTVHNTAINTLRLWLAKGGVFSEGGWDVDQDVKERLVGLKTSEIEAVVDLEDDQRAFLLTLCRINPAGWYKAADVRALAEATFSIKLGRESLPQRYLEPLKLAGFINYKSGGTSGGKSAILNCTPKFKATVLRQFLSDTAKTLDAALMKYFTQRPKDIYSGLKSSDKYVKGWALEAYAVHIMRLLGLRFMYWRKRSQESTGQAEVDALLAGMFGGAPTRWQVQCKNTPKGKVDLEDVAKEIGLLPITKATHVMLLANCGYTSAAQQFASRINQTTSATVYLLDKTDFDAVCQSAGVLGKILVAKGTQVLRQQPKETWPFT